MDSHNSDLETTLKDVLQDGLSDAATYTHVECKIGGVKRVEMTCRSLANWLKDHPQDSAAYVLVNRADYTTALDNTGLGPGIVSTKEGTQKGKIFMVHYPFWTLQHTRKSLEVPGNLIIVMDMGFGARTTAMAVVAMELLHNIQGLLQGKQMGKTVSWVSVSYSDKALLSERSGHRVDGLLLPRFGMPRVCHQELAPQKADDLQPPGEDWRCFAVERILETCIGDKITGVALAFVMSTEDAYHIRDELSTRSPCRPVTIHFIQPWMDLTRINDAVRVVQGLNIVCIDPEVSIVPVIHNLNAVIVAPVFNGYAFDINTTSVVRKRVVYDFAGPLATSLRETQGISVFVVTPRGAAQTAAKVKRHLIEPEEQSELSTASDRDFLYIHLAAATLMSKNAYPGILSMIVPPVMPRLDEATRRLDIWHLLKRSDLLPGVEPRSESPSPLAESVARFVRVKYNVHSLALLAHTERPIPVRIKQVLIDIAILISHDLSSVTRREGTATAPHDHEKIIQGLGLKAEFAKKHCHKGLVWQMLAYLHAYRKLMASPTRRVSELRDSGLDGVVRIAVLYFVEIEVRQFRKCLKIPTDDEASELSEKDFELVEAILVSAFPFNLMMVHTEEVGYFGRDLTSEVILERETDGETVNWSSLKQEVKSCGTQPIMAIYSHLWMDTSDNDRSVYSAVGTTAVSSSAFVAGLRYLGIEHYNCLRPVIRPERPCLIPKGESW